MTPYYTKEGDQGDTGFLGAGKISKASVRIEAVGSVDEATAALGLARALVTRDQSKRIILQIQKQLYTLMTELSADPKVADQFVKINEMDVKWLEEQINFFEDLTELPREFIIPGENLASGALSIARTVVRRAERRTIAIFESKGIQSQVLIAYLNRLSSLLFIMEVFESSHSEHGIRLAKED